jgi:hypothetical protein
MLTYLDRYLNGEQKQVWDELSKKDNAIYREPLLTDALSVTRETMKRVLYNIELLIMRLNAIGYVFGVYPDGRSKVYEYYSPRNLPFPDIVESIVKCEALDGIGSFPLSLRMFWEIVGDVDFTGYHPSWPLYSDPLIVFPIESIKADYHKWRYQTEEGDIVAGLFGVPISPDYYHKANISGGEPYRIRVPNYMINGILENERNNTTFVNYLRICFRYGGFPGFRWDKKAIPKEISFLVDGLKNI